MLIQNDCLKINETGARKESLLAFSIISNRSETDFSIKSMKNERTFHRIFDYFRELFADDQSRNCLLHDQNSRIELCDFLYRSN